MAQYTVHQAAGWHNESTDPVIMQTDDEQEAKLRAGCRADISMPGGCNRYDAYAVDDDGRDIGRIESFRCNECGEIVPWGETGPVGTMGGKILDCPGSVEKHLVSWLCDDCAEKIEAENP